MSPISAGGKLGVLAQRQADVLRQRHRAPQRAALVEHAEAAQLLLPRLVVGLPEGNAVVEDVAPAGCLQADQVAQQRALAAAAAAHDDEDLAALDRGVMSRMTTKVP